ncbi:glycine betaine ABC transporter substrate-binding protein [Pseudoclavibacter sp. RFBA6]|uniref:glycine betaine ABC transporter substrate-binding protein n=1 Tax=Pseudoclavibacter sp. RFBA6 TaxID=2080573 RepID=UPI0015E1F897|nr:glycine betaine ABC transporter substrate-binding protein [Pseudoclavibacter sp. RFBA6]
MNKKLKAGALGLASVLILAGCSGVEPNPGGFGFDVGSDETITFFATPGYDDTVSLTALWDVLLTERDYTVETQSVDLAAGFSGMARGDIDAYVDAWLPITHAPYIEPLRDQLVVFDEDEPIFDNNRLVFAVPESSPHNTVAEALAAGDQYGSEIIGIEAGSGLMGTLPSVLDAYGASDKFTVTAGSTPAMLASLQKATNDGKNVLVTLWTPHWAFSEMPIKALEDTEGAWGEADGSYLVTSQAFAEDHPDVAEWIKNSRIDDEQFSSLMFEVSQAATPQEGAKAWLEDPANRQHVDAWFD